MDQPTWIGRTLSGRYRIDALLGQGGMSAVYKATDPNLKRTVAVKLIHSHLSYDPSFIHRFESEASAVASLRHPNIVQVYDFNNDNGVYYMVLEFIAGETLENRLRRLTDAGRLLPIEDALKFTAHICDAIGYAHQRGMVHRDIKPANIMLDVQGQAILMDFGIVKILGGDSHTSTGAVVGTARYMSPEIIRGEAADHRSDIYSLGVTLYEMLSGRLPFEADSAMTLMMMHLNDPVPDVRDFRENVPNTIVDAVEKALQKERQYRYQSAAEMAADLKRLATSSELGTVAGKSAAVKKERPVTPDAAPRPAPQPDKIPSTPARRTSGGLIKFALIGLISLFVVAAGIWGLSSLGNDATPTAAIPTTEIPPSATSAPSETPSQAPSLTETSVPQYFVYITASRVTLYKGPGLAYGLASPKQYPKGEKFNVLAKNPSGLWFLSVAADGAEGWLYIDWVDVSVDPLIIPTASFIPAAPVEATHKPGDGGGGNGSPDCGSFCQ